MLRVTIKIKENTKIENNQFKFKVCKMNKITKKNCIK